MTSHSRLSPSKRHRWGRCPGSIREEALLPESHQNKGSPAATDGTHSHTLLEYCVDNFLLDPLSTIGSTYTDHEGEFTVDLARAERVKVAIDYIRLRIDKVRKTYRDDSVKVLSEKRVDPKNLVGRDDLGGTVDIQIIGRDILEIVDYKDGMIPVSVKENLQLEQYAIGVLSEHGADANGGYPWKEVRLTIVQPKLSLRNMTPITTWTVVPEYLLSRAKVLSAEAAATDDPNAPLVPGEEQCKFCPMKSSCSALVGHVMNEIDVEFDESVGQALSATDQISNKDPSKMDDAQLSKVMQIAPLMRQMLEAVEKEAQRRLENGATINGLKLVNGRGTRAWAFSEEEMVEKLKKMGIPKSSMYVTKLVSPAQAEKLTWEKKDGTKMALSKVQLERLDKEYITHLGGKPTVALESDPRREISNKKVRQDVSGLFGPVDSSPSETLPSWLLTKPE